LHAPTSRALRDVCSIEARGRDVRHDFDDTEVDVPEPRAHVHVVDDLDADVIAGNAVPMKGSSLRKNTWPLRATRRTCTFRRIPNGTGFGRRSSATLYTSAGVLPPTASCARTW
jgi:hypothetical protein